MFYVLSFDPDKVKIAVTPDGKAIVNKRTTEMEYKNIISAKQHLLKHRFTLTSRKWGNILISVAEIYEWNQNTETLSTFFCQGKNLEEILRSSCDKERKDWISLIRKIFETFKLNGFLWGDFAPRNIIFDQFKRVLWFVDFERELRLKDCPIDQNSFNRYVREYSREEFSCFLEEEECSPLFNGFLEENRTNAIPINRISSKRKRGLLKNIFGDKECYPLEEVRQIENLMIFVATPFRVNGSLFFPIDSLDKISNKGGPNEYVKTVLSIRSRENYARFSELKRLTAAL